MSRFRNILHASDFSRASSAAFRRAVDLARTNRANLTIVHAYAPFIPLMDESYASAQAYEKMLSDIRADAQRQLDRLVAKAKQAGARAKGLLWEGIAYDRIVRAARSTRADVIVIGTHGRTGLRRALLGSVASRVITLAPCPVLTVRAK